MLLATLCGMVIPAAAAITAVLLLGPPNVPHGSRLALLVAGALTLAEAVFAGLTVGALIEAAWRGVALPGSGPVDYLPLRWGHRRSARRNLIALSRGADPGRIALRRRERHVAQLCFDVGGRLGLSGMDCEQVLVAALAYCVAGGISPADAQPSAAWALAAVIATYDALTSDRLGGPGLARDEAVLELRAMGLDPDSVDALMEVETEKGSGGRRLAGVRLLGGLLVSRSGIVRRGRHVLRTSATPAAAGATVVAMLGAGLFGFLPALEGVSVLALRTTGPSVVVRGIPTPTDAGVPTGGSSTRPGPSSSRSSKSPAATGTGTGDQRAPLYFPSAVPHRVVSTPLSGVLPGTVTTVTSMPAPSQLPVVSVTQVAVPVPTGGATSTAAPPSVSPMPTEVGPVADKIVSANEMGASPTRISPPVSTTSANELILAFISADGPAPGTQSVTSVSGGGLSWSLAARSNTQLGTAEVWQAYATAQLSNVTVAATLGGKGHGSSITIASFTGAAATVGATAAGGAATGAPAVAVAARAGSLLWAVGRDGSQAVSPTPLGGQTVVHEFLDAQTGHASWVQAAVRTPSASSVVTVGESAPVLDRWDLVAVEIASGR